MRTIFLSLLFVGPTLSAQQASYTFISQPPHYINHTWLAPLSPPRLGTTWTIQMPCDEVSFASADTYYLVTGVAAVYLDLGAIYGNLARGVQLTSAEIITRSPCRRSRGFGTLAVPIPNTPALLGLDFYQQVVRVRTFGMGGVVPRLAEVDLSRGGYGVIGT